MRKRILAITLLAAAGLAFPAPAPAQFNRGEPTIVVDVHAAKKKRTQRRIVTAGVVGCITLGLFVFIFLNAMERRAARQALLRKQLERQERGLA